MSEQITTSRLANTMAREVCRAFVHLQYEFRKITQRAKHRFAQRDWQGLQADTAARLDVYQRSIDQLVDRTDSVLGNRVLSRLVWVSIKAVYSGLIDNRDDCEIAETFFNSVTRRIFTTVGVDDEIEFVHTDFGKPPTPPITPVHRSFAANRAVGPINAPGASRVQPTTQRRANGA